MRPLNDNSLPESQPHSTTTKPGGYKEYVLIVNAGPPTYVNAVIKLMLLEMVPLKGLALQLTDKN